jgi:hypothetical protein
MSRSAKLNGNNRQYLTNNHQSIRFRCDDPAYTCAANDISVVTHWRAIEKVVDVEEYVFVFYTPSTACIVPKRAFQSDENVKMFVALAKEYHSQARESSPTENSSTLPPV